MKLFKSMAVLSIFSILFLFSCSDSTTNPKEDKDPTEIPDNAIEFPSPQAAAEFATSSLNGVGEFAAGALWVFDESAKKPASVTADSLYYQDGWWYYSASDYYSDGGTGFSMEVNNKYQFSKDGSVQKEWETADKVHAIIDAEGNYTAEGSSMDLKFYFDITYKDFNRNALPVTMDGNGYYDISLTSGDSGEQRYYITYAFKSLKLPYDGYPTGELVVGTKKYEISMLFNGTNMVTVSVMQDGKTVYSMQYDLDSEDV